MIIDETIRVGRATLTRGAQAARGIRSPSLADAR